MIKAIDIIVIRLEMILIDLFSCFRVLFSAIISQFSFEDAKGFLFVFFI